MWKHVFSFAGRLWSLLEDTPRSKSEIKDLPRELDEMADQVQWLALELRRVVEHEASEREQLALRLENDLLRVERRLPAAKGR
jgi:hypothetical protein